MSDSEDEFCMQYRLINELKQEICPMMDTARVDLLLFDLFLKNMRRQKGMTAGPVLQAISGGVLSNENMPEQLLNIRTLGDAIKLAKSLLDSVPDRFPTAIVSDYRPPGAEKNINDMPEECIRLIFLPLSMLDLMNAGQVCKLWNSVQKAVFRIKKSLIILAGKDTSLRWMCPPNYIQSHLGTLLKDDGKPMNVDTLQLDYEYIGLKSEKLLMYKIILLHTTFSNVTELTLGCRNGSQRLLGRVERLITKFGNQLVTLKLTLHHAFQNHKGLCDAINALSKLKHLHIKLYRGLQNLFPAILNVDLPILGQLEQFHFHTFGPNPSIAQHWAPYLESRAQPLQIAFTGITVDQADLFSIQPTVGVVTHAPLMIFPDLHQLTLFTVQFTNLVHFSFHASDLLIPRLLRAIAKLKQLISLSISVNYSHAFDHDGHQMAILSQLSSVKQFCLIQNLSCHADLTRWNLGWTMPNLQLLYISREPWSGIMCTDCHYGSRFEEPIKQCYRQQLRSLKQQCAGLRAAELCYYQVKCRLDEIAD